jgi:hypothetical protein
MRTAAALGVAAALLLPLTGCEKARLDDQVRELCAKDGGVKVFETVKVSAEMLDSHGNVRIPTKAESKSGDAYYSVLQTEHLKTGNPELWRSRRQVVRASDGKVLGEWVRYVRRGGDLPGPWHESSFGCPEIGSALDLERSIFLRKD